MYPLFDQRVTKILWVTLKAAIEDVGLGSEDCAAEEPGDT